MVPVDIMTDMVMLGIAMEGNTGSGANLAISHGSPRYTYRTIQPWYVHLFNK